MNKDKIVLVTGGAGYIGSHFIIDLLESGYTKIISVDNYSNSSEKTYARIHEITGAEIDYYEMDLNDFESLKSVFDKNDIQSIVHFAAHKAVGESVDKPLMYYRNNLNSLINVLECCSLYKVNKFIFSSSCTVYGEPESIPVTEGTAIQRPQSPYGNTKKIAEEIIEDYSKNYPDFKCTLLRYFNPVGAHSSGLIGELPLGVPNNLVPFITQTAIGIREKITVFGNDYKTRDGSCIRDYVHVMDITSAHILALEKLDQSSEQILRFNLGTGNGVSVLEVIDAFERATGEKLNFEIGEKRFGDVAAIFSDSKKAYDELKWEIKYSIDEMMTSAWLWQKQLAHES